VLEEKKLKLKKHYDKLFFTKITEMVICRNKTKNKARVFII